MPLILWVVNGLISLLSAINAICWGYAIREVGNPEFSLSFLFKLVFNRFYLGAMFSAFIASLLTFLVYKEMGVLAGRFFILLNIASMTLACTLVLGEQLTPKEWLGALFIVIGVILIGRL